MFNASDTKQQKYFNTFFKGLHSAHGTGLNVLSQTPLEHPETINLNRSPETAYLAFCLLPNAKTHAMLNLQSAERFKLGDNVALCDVIRVWGGRVQMAEFCVSAAQIEGWTLVTNTSLSLYSKYKK